MSTTCPNIAITCSPSRRGTALMSTRTRSPSAFTKTTSLSERSTTPEILRAKISLARRASSGESTEVNWRPRTSPTISIAAALTRVKSGGFDLDRGSGQELPVDLARLHDVDASVELEPDGAERFPRHPVLDGPHERCEVRS